MKRVLAVFGFVAIVIITFGCSTATSEEPRTSPVIGVRADQTTFKLVRPILEKHCFECHSGKKTENDLDLTKLDPDVIHGADAEEWQDILDQLNTGAMPPKKKSTLTTGEREQLTSWLTTQLKMAAEERRSTGGRTVLRRMTRYEYNNTMHDLLGVDMDFAKNLPPESAAELGFQNNSKVLVTSFLHMDYFQKSAKAALELA
ncbi:MAG: DUF1587 domain-containing protein, partial [Planctomycetota bacterium]